MKVLVVGHSYARDLKSVFPVLDNLSLELKNEEKVHFDLRFLAYPGKDYRYFLDHPELFELIKDAKPDIIVIILGGNSIVASKTNSQINQEIRLFYTHLKTVLGKDCIRLAVQIEARFALPNNPFGTPLAEEYNQRRNVINNYVNKNMKRAKLVDGIISLGGVGFLNNESEYRDGVHLKQTGLLKYQIAFLHGIQYALNKRL